MKFKNPEEIKEALQKASNKAKAKKVRPRLMPTSDLNLNYVTPIMRKQLSHNLVGMSHDLVGIFLGDYENLKYLSDMNLDRKCSRYDDEFKVDVFQALRGKGLEALRKLISSLVPEDRLDGAFDFVVKEYDKEWDRYLRDKERGLVVVGSDDYINYSWRGCGPKPYFEGLVLKYLKILKKKYRSIDDP